MQKDLSKTRDFRNYKAMVKKEGTDVDVKSFYYIWKLLQEVEFLKKRVSELESMVLDENGDSILDGILSGEDKNVANSEDAGRDSSE